MTKLNDTLLQYSGISQNISSYFSTFYEKSVETHIVGGFTIIFSMLGLAGNGTVLWFLCFHLKKNSFLFITNLAIADFGVLFVSCCKYLLFYMVYLHRNFKKTIYITDMCLYALYHFLVYASACFLMAISSDRCLAVLFPIWHRCHRPKPMFPMISALLWALAFLLSGLVFFSAFWCKSYLSGMILFYIFESFIVTTTLVLFVNVYCYSRLRRRGELLKAILLSLAFFIVTMFPQNFFVFIQDRKKETALHWLFNSLNSSINPAIYFFFGRRRSDTFRKSVEIALQRVFKEEEDERSEGEPSAGQTSL